MGTAQQHPETIPSGLSSSDNDNTQDDVPSALHPDPYVVRSTFSNLEEAGDTMQLQKGYPTENYPNRRTEEERISYLGISHIILNKLLMLYCPESWQLALLILLETPIVDHSPVRALHLYRVFFSVPYLTSSPLGPLAVRDFARNVELLPKSKEDCQLDAVFREATNHDSFDRDIDELDVRGDSHIRLKFNHDPGRYRRTTRDFDSDETSFAFHKPACSKRIQRRQGCGSWE
ncbi:hypothetical protein V8E54_007512 [Elaphomyces granulatus]|jgi:hypothetical protein